MSPGHTANFSAQVIMHSSLPASTGAVSVYDGDLRLRTGALGLEESELSKEHFQQRAKKKKNPAAHFSLPSSWYAAPSLPPSPPLTPNPPLPRAVLRPVLHRTAPHRTPTARQVSFTHPRLHQLFVGRNNCEIKRTLTRWWEKMRLRRYAFFAYVLVNSSMDFGVLS